MSFVSLQLHSDSPTTSLSLGHLYFVGCSSDSPFPGSLLFLLSFYFLFLFFSFP